MEIQSEELIYYLISIPDSREIQTEVQKILTFNLGNTLVKDTLTGVNYPKEIPIKDKFGNIVSTQKTVGVMYLKELWFRKVDKNAQTLPSLPS